MQKKNKGECKTAVVRIRLTPNLDQQLKKLLAKREIKITTFLTDFIELELQKEIDKNQIKLFDK